MELALPIIVLAILLGATAVLLRRQRSRRPETVAAQPEKRSARRQHPPEEIDVVHPRPEVAEMHVVGEEARVRFNVPLPVERDDVLAELLVNEAVEVIREKSHTLPMAGVHAVVALAGTHDAPKVVGKASLETPGKLPPPVAGASMLNLSSIAADPLERSFLDHAYDEEAKPEMHVETVARVPEDDLETIGSALRVPKAIEVGLRAQGIDPVSMTATQLVTGTLALVGYRVNPGMADGTFVAEKAGTTTFIREDRYTAGDYPEIDGEAVRRFLFEFQSSDADRGMYVTEKYAPFEIYEVERREPRIRFISRERLQKFVDAVSLS